MKTITFIIAALLLLAACAQTEEVKPYKFGAVLSLTGPQAFYGEFSKAGIELAIEDLNKAGGINGRPVQIIYEDSVSEKAKATTGAQKLVNVDNVDALLTSTTTMAGAVAPVAEDNQVPMIYGSATDFTINKTYVFKDYPSAYDECALLMKEALKQGHSKIALFGMNAEFLHVCKNGAETVGKLAIVETYNSGDKDFKTQLAKVQNSGSTALMILTFSNDCLNTYKQMRELGMKPQLYLAFQAFGCGTPENTKVYPELFDKAIGAEVAIDLNGTDPEFVAFKKRLEEKGWTAQIIGSAVMYDGVMEMAKAMQGCTDNLCIANNLRNLNNYKGVSGTISYNGDNVVEREIMFTKWVNGKWVKA